MIQKHEFHLTLDDFTGPIDLLIALIQENELAAENVLLKEILGQFKELSEPGFDLGAEFIQSASALLLLKSRALLPEEPQEIEEERQSALERQQAIRALIEYVKFKKAGEELCHKDKELASIFTRGSLGMGETPRPLGVDHLSMEDLGQLFKELMDKKSGSAKVIFEEVWKVSDKIAFIKRELAKTSRIAFYSLFHEKQSREEWIVTFLAILELMKLGLAQAVKEADSAIYVAAMKREN